MADQQELRDRLPGLYERSDGGGVTGVEITGAVICVLWLGLAVAHLWSSDTPPDPLLAALVVALPVALVWVAVMTARAARVARAETARLASAVDALRQAYVTQAQQGRADPPNPALMKRLDQIATAQAGLETKLTMIASAHIAEAASPGATVPATPEPDDQPALSLGTTAEDMKPPLSNADFIRALHFPETAEDTEGFAALRRALQDRQAAHLIQAAQDVLTLISQDGIYMDDLRPDLARPEVWRAFSQGTRGPAIAPLGGVHDRTSLALTAGRMKQDPIFRDAVHHFLRRFDRSFAMFEPNATDSEITDFAGTRTARAFMLLGRVAGTFD